MTRTNTDFYGAVNELVLRLGVLGSRYLFGGLLTVEPTTIKEEHKGVGVHSLVVAVGVHQLLQPRGSLDAEEDLFAVLQNKLSVCSIEH